MVWLRSRLVRLLIPARGSRLALARGHSVDGSGLRCISLKLGSRVSLLGSSNGLGLGSSDRASRLVSCGDLLRGGDWDLGGDAVGAVGPGGDWNFLGVGHGLGGGVGSWDWGGLAGGIREKLGEGLTSDGCGV